MWVKYCQNIVLWNVWWFPLQIYIKKYSLDQFQVTFLPVYNWKKKKIYTIAYLDEKFLDSRVSMIFWLQMASKWITLLLLFISLFSNSAACNPVLTTLHVWISSSWYRMDWYIKVNSHISLKKHNFFDASELLHWTFSESVGSKISLLLASALGEEKDSA